MTLSRIILCSLLLLGTETACSQQAPDAVPPFVQRFYDWYVPVARAGHDRPAWAIAVAEREALSTGLSTALRGDLEAQEAASGEITGLDFDPFLNTQDPCERYEVGAVTTRQQTFLAEVYSVCDGLRSKVPVVVAELQSKGTGLAFTNFRYGDERADLLSLLEELREARR